MTSISRPLSSDKEKKKPICTTHKDVSRHSARGSFFYVLISFGGTAAIFNAALGAVFLERLINSALISKLFPSRCALTDVPSSVSASVCVTVKREREPRLRLESLTVMAPLNHHILQTADSSSQPTPA